MLSVSAAMDCAASLTEAFCSSAAEATFVMAPAVWEEACADCSEPFWICSACEETSSAAAWTRSMSAHMEPFSVASIRTMLPSSSCPAADVSMAMR